LRDQNLRGTETVRLPTSGGFCLTGEGGLQAGKEVSADDAGTQRSLLRRGTRLLRTGAYAVPLDHAAQRRALFEGAWLAVAAASQGDLEECTVWVRATVSRPTVHAFAA
jgi:hypothetical protein